MDAMEGIVVARMLYIQILDMLHDAQNKCALTSRAGIMSAFISIIMWEFDCLCDGGDARDIEAIMEDVSKQYNKIIDELETVKFTSKSDEDIYIKCLKHAEESFHKAIRAKKVLRQRSKRPIHGSIACEYLLIVARNNLFNDLRRQNPTEKEVRKAADDLAQSVLDFYDHLIIVGLADNSPILSKNYFKEIYTLSHRIIHIDYVETNVKVLCCRQALICFDALVDVIIETEKEIEAAFRLCRLWCEIVRLMWTIAMKYPRHIYLRAAMKGIQDCTTKIVTIETYGIHIHEAINRALKFMPQLDILVTQPFDDSLLQYYDFFLPKYKFPDPDVIFF
ncbi:unnamed protein product [Strongylus vulgaris]|uniref:Uncharacterized protein n=1 Tax=Strongylus vulgaris TaxID=40348 RepID=A0A3P7JGB2_STRVU|nr:unnamed protein product [Strongylus vulgaris]